VISCILILHVTQIESLPPSIVNQMNSTECSSDAACEANRECGFGTIDNYKIARKALFEATGRSITTCNNTCTCTPANVSVISKLLNEAEELDSSGSNIILYGNNVVCNDSVMKAAMYYYTSGLPCEKVYSEAQSELIQLCGVQNGRSCYGKCTEHYQIDSPPPPCENKVGVDKLTMYLIGLYVFVTASLWSWTSSIDLSPVITTSSKLQTRYRDESSNKDTLIFFFT